MNTIGTVRDTTIEEEMKTSYLDYAMSVIVARALPDVRDGLKPVQRRILYAVNELGLHHSTPYKKSARIVGEVLGKYHPHGDAPVYDAMVRMAQDFSLRHLLIDGQGNFGSVDNDPPAAMRYTEARLSQIAQEMLTDIDKETVDFAPNFDNSLTEPLVLPSRLPNLLVNGSAGIAVGMATNIPPHNLSEVCSAIIYLVDHPEASVLELMQFVRGPDVPTGGVVLGQEGIRQAYTTGQGKITIRAKVDEVTSKSGGSSLIVSEIPYQTNKAALVEKIADLIRKKKIEGIGVVRDESDREGIRVVIELRKEAQADRVLNNLYKYTALQTAFFINMVALVGHQPVVINLTEALRNFVVFRKEVITRRCQFELRKAQERLHLVDGFRIALQHLEEVIATIRRSGTVEEARQNLETQFNLSRIQAQAILDMQLRRLARLEQTKIDEEYASLTAGIAHLERTLAEPQRILDIIKDETLALKEKYGEDRRTLLVEEEVQQFQDEDLIPHQNVVVLLTSQGYVKRVPYASYHLQHRGGRGIRSGLIRDDNVTNLAACDTHDNLLLIMTEGKAYRLKCYQVPPDMPHSKGTSLANLLPIPPGEKKVALLTVHSHHEYLLLVSKRGKTKRVKLQNLKNIRTSGLTVVGLEKGDELADACLAKEGDEVLMLTEQGRALRFPSAELRAMSRAARGVRGMRLDPKDRIIAAKIVSPDAHLLTLTDMGFGKLTPLARYPVHHRGTKGIMSHRINQKTGKLVAARIISPDERLVLTTHRGNLLVVSAEEIPVLGRASQGVHVAKIEKGDRLAQ
ncbi:MAG: DNA gyrase subunit A, partial [Chloroflexota bacterium]